MIFTNINSVNISTDESYKERNLYNKIFAGYLLNELVPGYKERKIAFIQLMQEKLQTLNSFYGEKKAASMVLSDMSNDESVHLTFDFHTAQVITENKQQDDDRGEMSDILLLSKSAMISIECKFLSDINYHNDVTAVQVRIQKFSKLFNKQPLQVLLVKQSKWAFSKSIKEQIKEVLQVPVVLLFWEDLLSIIKDETVRNYLQLQLERK